MKPHEKFLELAEDHYGVPVVFTAQSDLAFLDALLERWLDEFNRPWETEFRRVLWALEAFPVPVLLFYEEDGLMEISVLKKEEFLRRLNNAV